MASQRGKDFGVGDMLKVVMVLADKLALKRGWDENACGKIGGLENRPLMEARESGSSSWRKSGVVCCACFHSSRVVGRLG